MTPPPEIYDAAYWPAPPDMPELAPGVRGLRYDTQDTIWFGWIHSEAEGQGKVGAYLDALPTDRAVVFLSVISSILTGMLERRGYRYTGDLFHVPGDVVDGWRRA